MASMKKEEARQAVLGEYDRWAKKHPNDARMMGGFLFFRYLQDEKSDFLDFRAVGDEEVANRSRLATGSVAGSWPSPPRWHDGRSGGYDKQGLWDEVKVIKFFGPAFNAGRFASQPWEACDVAIAWSSGPIVTVSVPKLPPPAWR